jgi:hypothetical protein
MIGSKTEPPGNLTCVEGGLSIAGGALYLPRGAIDNMADYNPFLRMAPTRSDHSALVLLTTDGTVAGK